MANIMERFEANRGKSPDEAGMYWSGGPVEVASRTWFVSNFSGVTAFETQAGLVLVDSGTERLAPGLAAQLRENTQAPVHLYARPSRSRLWSEIRFWCPISRDHESWHSARSSTGLRAMSGPPASMLGSMQDNSLGHRATCSTLFGCRP